MALQKQHFEVPYAEGRILITFDLERQQAPPVRQTLRFEMWFFTRDIPEAIVFLNPTLDIRLYRSTGPSGWLSNDMVRLPVGQGHLDAGGVAASRAVIWRPAAYLPAELVLRLDALRDAQHGFHAELKLSVAALGTDVNHRNTRDGPHNFLAPQPIDLIQSFPVTNEDWRNMLEHMAWPTPRVFELHPLSFSNLSEFEEAAKRLQEAERQFFLGHWGDCVAKARMVIEAVFRKLGYKDRSSFNWNAIVAEGLPTEMAELFKAVNQVANHEHHPTGADLRWQRADARFMLQMAATLAEYVGTLPPRTRQP